jgi:hypothetical protein
MLSIARGFKDVMHSLRQSMVINKVFKKKVIAPVFFILLLCFTAHALAAASAKQQIDAVVIIYIDDGSGRLITTGSGFVVDANGIITTTHEVLSHWIETPSGNLFVKTESGALFQVEDIIAVDRAQNVALFSINAKNLREVSLMQEYRPTMDDNVIVIGSPSGKKIHISSGRLRLDEGNILLSASPGLSRGYRGGPVVSRNGQVIGVVDVTADGMQKRHRVIPAMYIYRLLDGYKRKKNKMAPPLQKHESDNPVSASSELMEKLEHAQAAVERNPNSAEALSRLAWTYIHAGKYEAASEIYEDIIKIEPDIVDTYNNLGVVYGKYLGMPEKAVSVFKTALRIKPDADIHSNLGNAYIDLGMYREALVEYQLALKARPYYARAHFGLGISFLRLNERDAAFEEYEILKKLNPALADELYVHLSTPAVPLSGE